MSRVIADVGYACGASKQNSRIFAKTKFATVPKDPSRLVLFESHCAGVDRLETADRVTCKRLLTNDRGWPSSDRGWPFVVYQVFIWSQPDLREG